MNSLSSINAGSPFASQLWHPKSGSEKFEGQFRIGVFIGSLDILETRKTRSART